MLMFFRKKLVCQTNREPYSLCTDGSDDKGLVKINPLLVRVFDDEKGKVISQLLDMGTCVSCRLLKLCLVIWIR